MLAPPQDALSAVIDPSLAPLFHRPSRVGIASAWYGHVPFGYWLVAQARPRVIVELGTHNGVSYSAFCDAVVDQRLPTRCFAVDTWQGDVHAGLYGEEVFAEFQRFHDLRFRDFSTLLRMTFDEALGQMPDASVDLLHIDGLHSYEAVRHDFESWLPKLSDRAIVLFHDTNVREREFGVWTLWNELRQDNRSFEFLHASGLGMLAIGEQVPTGILALCGLADEATATVRDRFSRLGERLEFQFVAGDLEATRAKYHTELSEKAALAQGKADEAVAEAERVWQEASKAWNEIDTELKSTRQLLLLTRRELDDTRAAWAGARRAQSEIARHLADIVQEFEQAKRERGEFKSRLSDREVELATACARLAEMQQRLADVEHELKRAAESIAGHSASTASHQDGLARQIDSLRGELDEARREIARLSDERDIIIGSTMWRATAPLRAATRGLPQPVRRSLRRMLRGFRRSTVTQQPAPAPIFVSEPLPVSVPATETPPLIESVPGLSEVALPAVITPAAAEPSVTMGDAGTSLDIKLPGVDVLFISGEPDIPGHTLRVLRHVDAARSLGLHTAWIKLSDVAQRRDEITRASFVVIWRAVNSPEVVEAIAAAREGGAMLIFDVDDLMFKPELASETIIDGIRTQGLIEAEVANYYQRVKDVVMQMDACICTTSELARHLRELDRTTFVLPNCFDFAVLNASRLAVRRRVPADEGIIRIGYAAGTRTHQRDFRLAAEALGRLLRDRGKCRLVLFRSPADGVAQLDPNEFPSLTGLENQIEWRDLVTLDELPNELARFDINLSPLEIGNPFCESKSELKYYEAALVDICTVASPTGPMRRAIREGETGMLADTAEEWYRALLALVDDQALRERLGRSACHDALARFGPERSAAALSSILTQLAGNGGAVRAFELDLLRQQTRSAKQVDIPASEVMFTADLFGTADVTVIIPLYNYAQFIEEALDSVRDQTLSDIDMIVVDDASTDASLEVTLAWVRQNAARFNRVVVVRNQANVGLARSRNVGIERAHTRYVLPLDADNRLLPACCERLLLVLQGARAAFAYPQQQCFGTAHHVIGTEPFSATRLANGNYIDAMALIAKSAWATIGGYTHIEYGWEDYDFWCCCVEHGMYGCHVPEILAEYRFHHASMRLTSTDRRENNLKVIRQLEERHSWLSITYRDYAASATDEPAPTTGE